MDRALRNWAARMVRTRPDVLQIGYFGSYARGDWGVGSDLDVIVIVENSGRPFESRASEWDLAELPVPADLLVYTREEWRHKISSFPPKLVKEIVWVSEHENLR